MQSPKVVSLSHLGNLHYFSESTKPQPQSERNHITILLLIFISLHITNLHYFIWFAFGFRGISLIFFAVFMLRLISRQTFTQYIISCHQIAVIWRKIRTEEFHDACMIFTMMMAIKLVWIRYGGGGEVAHTGGIKNSYNILVDKSRRNGPLGSVHR